ncbi:MAG TPA: FAD-binding oxidoreductase [Streptosporangiaceae bacterium]|nr:FAD-binding oxidoreductase [Streptosporangiaceae bacterium]
MTDVTTQVRPGSPEQRHRDAVAAIQQAYQAIPAGSPIRLAKSTSNLFWFRADTTGSGLDVAQFAHVISVDPEARTAVVGGMTTYEDLVKATLRHGLMPLVVPQLKTITLGGAVSGLGIESSSLRNGMPHESVLAMEILTGDGQVVTATATGEHAALYRGFPNSYGTLGYTLSLTIELEPVKPYVHLRHFRFTDPAECFAAVAQVAADGSYDGHQADFIDGTAFSQQEMYLTVGAFSDVAPWRSDYTRERIYYQSLRGPREDFLTISDYLWRWDTDWFWCSRPFGVQRPVIRALWPRRYRRSDVYRKLVALDHKHGVTRKLDARRGRPETEMVIQDVEIPVAQSATFLDYFLADVGMTPVWMCPLRLRGERTWPLYPMRPGQVYVNFGFWGTVKLPAGATDGYFNRRIEDKVTELGGHKGLYSTSFYPREEFWARYNGPEYAGLKRAYDPQGRLADLYDKCVRGV